LADWSLAIRFSSLRNCFASVAGFPCLLESPEFFLENSRTSKVLENRFGPGKSWILKLKVLESPGKNVQESHAFLDFFLKIPGPGKSWKITLVLENVLDIKA